MNVLGYVLLIVGFLAASYFTATDVSATDWSYFVPSALVAIGGVLLLKQHAKGEAKAEHVLTANRNELNESLGNIVLALDALDTKLSSLSTGDIRVAIDAALRDDLRRFADARESMIHLYSIQAYADIMSEFAAGERYVNRAWSASADDYRNESTRYVARAREQFRHALTRLQQAAA